MYFQAQKCSQRQADVISLCSPASGLASLNPRELFDAAMEILYRPSLTSIFHSHKLAHLQIVGRPVFNVAVCSDYPEYFYKAVLFEMNDASSFRDFCILHCAIPTAVWIDQTILFQARQPYPIHRANQFKIRVAAIPTVEY